MHESSSRFIGEDFRIPSFIRLARIRATVPAYCPQRKLLFTAVSGMPYFHAARNRAAAISSAAKAASWFDLSKQELRLSTFRPHDSRRSSPRANSRSFDPRPRPRARLVPRIRKYRGARQRAAAAIFSGFNTRARTRVDRPSRYAKRIRRSERGDSFLRTDRAPSIIISPLHAVYSFPFRLSPTRA